MMSHYTVLVPAQDEDDLRERLLPYHEYECTGIERYLEWVDRTDEGTELYNTEVREFVRLGNGELKSKYDDQFYVETIPDPSTPWRKNSEFVLPDGAELVEMTCAEAGMETFEEFMDDYYGAKPIPDQEGRWGCLTNPNSKWDWYSVGGRWSGLLALKPIPAPPLLRGNTEVAGLNRNEVDFLVGLYKDNGGKFEKVVAKYGLKANEIRCAVEQIANHENGEMLPQGELGSPGVFGTGYNCSNGRADTALMREVDWDGMSQERREDRGRSWDNWETALSIGGKSTEWYFKDFEPKWKAACEANDSDLREELREEWRAMREIVWDAFEGKEDREISWALDFKPEGRTREEYVDSEHALTFAFVDLEGKWNERGNMGWWAVVTDKNADYDDAFWEFVKSLSDDQRIYVVDCHI